MHTAILVTGRLTGPKSVELDEALSTSSGPVEVIVRATQPRNHESESLSEFLRALPPGKRDRDDIDLQMLQERDSWGDR
jgi:hypothetical protein